MFEDVRYRVHARREVTLSNTGQVFTHFRVLLPKQVGNWLKIYPTYGLIMPREALQIAIHVQVSARSLC